MKNYALAVLILTAGCATGSHQVTGQLRPAVSPADVMVYYSLPANSKIIGTVSAGSFGGVTFQDASDYALAKLKLEAGNMGANGIILEYLDNKALGGAKLKGQAIYVAPVIADEAP